jgi:hypothetical protein
MESCDIPFSICSTSGVVAWEHVRQEVAWGGDGTIVVSLSVYILSTASG